MSIIMQINPFEFFTDTNGDALDSGYIWIGETNKYPPSFPVAAYYDEALTIPAAMPLRTSNGYIVRNGAPTFLYIDGNYSILVMDKRNRQIFYVPDFLMIGSGKAVSQAQFDGLSNTTDPTKGDAIIGVKQPVAGSVGRTQHDKNSDFYSVKDFGAIGNGLADDTASIQAAFNSGVSLHFPKGTYMVSAPITANTPGQQIKGDGPSSSIIRAITSFAGSGLVILGNKSNTTIVIGMAAENMTIDCNAVAGVIGLEAYGLRDGTRFSSVYVSNNKNSPGIKTGVAGDAPGSAGGRMCEGVQFLNCHVITGQDMDSTFFWQLDGLFESQLIGCKALGFSSAAVTNTSGFKIGGIAEVRGVAMIGCSAGNFATSNNYGIRYGEWARESWDQFTTFENIMGSAVYFHGSTVSGSALPSICRSIDPRPYNSSVAGVLDPLYKFGDSNACYAGVIDYYNSTKTWARFDPVVTSQFNNFVEIFSGVAPQSLTSVIIDFHASSSASNVAYGFASDTAGARKRFTINKGLQTEVHEGNGFFEQHDSDWDTINLAPSNKQRVRSFQGVTMLSIQAGTIVAEDTCLALTSNKGGTNVFNIVSIGPVNSGGSGYRALRILN